MKLGAFSVSLTVKDIDASIDFYSKLGFELFHGEVSQGWAILNNNGVKIGLFQGMFDKNLLTFNPGWDQNAQPVDDFTDVRVIQKSLEEAGIEITKPIGDSENGPGSLMITDPDGNPILLDQHV